MDEEHERFQATIEESRINNFKHEIEKHGLYLMNNFCAAINNESFKLVVHPWKFFFQENTQILPGSLDNYSNFLMKLYNFKNVDESLRAPQSSLNHLIDFIGAYGPSEGFTTGQNKNNCISVRSGIVTKVHHIVALICHGRLLNHHSLAKLEQFLNFMEQKIWVVLKGCLDPACAKEVDVVGDEYVCSKYENKVTDPVARYGIKYEVNDGKSKTFILFWDELSQLLFGKKVVDFVNEMAKSVGDHSPPKEIMEFMGKSYLFKLVGISHYN